MRGSPTQEDLVFIVDFHHNLATSAGDGGDNQYFVPFLKAVRLIAKEADVLFIHIEIDEAADRAVFAAQMLAQSRETAFDIRHQFRQIRGGAGDFADVVGVLLERIR